MDGFMRALARVAKEAKFHFRLFTSASTRKTKTSQEKKTNGGYKHYP